MRRIKRRRLVPGLTQTELAEYLGVTKTHIYFAELSIRELPKEAEKKLMSLLLKLENWKKSEKASNRLLEEKARQKKVVTYVQNKIKDCHYRTLRLERKLEIDREIYEKHCSAMAVNSVIAEEVKKGRASVKEIAWLNNHDVVLSERLQKNNTVIHAMTQLQIDLLSAQQKVYEKFVETNK